MAKNTAQTKAPTKPCERCGRRPALPGQRYCRDCRRTVLEEMKASGYLQEIPQEPPTVSDVVLQEEEDDGAWDNAISAVEQ